jgi:hypothetical protein
MDLNCAVVRLAVTGDAETVATQTAVKKQEATVNVPIRRFIKQDF